MENEEIKTKKCIKCGLELPLSEFVKSAKTKDGYQHVCKKCRANKRCMTRGRDVRLANFTSRDLMRELKMRGYEGTILFVQRINLKDM